MDHHGLQHLSYAANVKCGLLGAQPSVLATLYLARAHPLRKEEKPPFSNDLQEVIKFFEINPRAGLHDDLAVVMPVRHGVPPLNDLLLHGTELLLQEVPHIGQVTAVDPVVVDGDGVLQVVDLVVPPTGHKHHLACLLCDLQWRATAISHGVQAAIQEGGGGHVVG